MDNFLNKDDLCILLSALNEIQNGIDVSEFETRIGASKEEIKELERKMERILNTLEEGDQM